jgi:membrane protease YdiL (CAAX protease family)
VSEQVSIKGKRVLSTRLERLIVIPAVILLAFIILRSTRFITDLVWPLVSALDPDAVFLWKIIRHLLQLAFTVLVMTFVFKIDLRQMGFNLNKRRESLRIFGWFARVYLVVVILMLLPNILSGTAPSFDYALTAKNMAGVLGFQILLTGTAEEPLFRGMVMIVLGKYMTGMHRIGNSEIPSSGVVAAILFTLAHVGFTISPFAITHFDPLQLFGAFVLGLFFAFVFHRTGSLLAPIIMHGYGNGILYVGRYSVAFLFG